MKCIQFFCLISTLVFFSCRFAVALISPILSEIEVTNFKISFVMIYGGFIAVILSFDRIKGK